MKYKVEKYNAAYDWEYPHFVHECTDEQGQRCYIDLLVNGDFKENIDPYSLVGKTVEVERTHAYIAIAHGVKIVKEKVN